MGMSDVRGPSDCDSDPCIDEILENHFTYIHVLAQRVFPHDVGPWDSDDLAQDSLLKLWLTLQRTVLTSPKSYIKRIVHNQAVDIVRKNKPCQPLLTDEDGEIQQGNLIVTAGEELDNPETILEQKEALAERLNELIDAVDLLYPRQKHATLCRLQDSAEDFSELEEALKEFGIDSEMQWPEDKVERQKLQASYSPARRKLAGYMKVDMELRK